MADVPRAVVNYFHAVYPTLQVDPDWLTPCLEYLAAHYPDSTTPQLTKLVEAQLLLSDLSSSTLPPPADADDDDSVLWKERKHALLVQVVEIDEIANPALGLLDTLKEKREKRGVGEVEDEQEGPEENGGKTGKWPRGVSWLRVADGHGRDWEAVEVEKVDGLGLEECQLGAKGVRNVRGMLLLHKKNCVVKGNAVEEFEEHREALLEERWRGRLGLPPLEHAAPPRASHSPSPPPVARNANPPRNNPPKQRAAPPPPPPKHEPQPEEEEEKEEGNYDETMEIDSEAERELALMEQAEADTRRGRVETGGEKGKGKALEAGEGDEDEEKMMMELGLEGMDVVIADDKAKGKPQAKAKGKQPEVATRVLRNRKVQVIEIGDTDDEGEAGEQDKVSVKSEGKKLKIGASKVKDSEMIVVD